MGQLSFYSADARPRAVSDLEGLLCAGGSVTRFGRGTSARLTVLLGTPPAPEPDVDPEDDESGDGSGDEGDAVHPEEHAPDASPDRAPPDDGPTPAPDVPPRTVDPEDLEFLDLDAEELARLLGGEPTRSRGVPDLGPGAPAPGTPAPGTQHDDPPAPAGAAPVRREPDPDPVLAWRAHAVCCALRIRGVAAELDRHADGRPLLRSAYRSDLVNLAGAWLDAREQKRLPAGFELDGPRLRLWVLAAGTQDGPGYTLGLDPGAGHLHDALLTASRRAGLGATLVDRGAAPALRIVGRRRLGRLAELVGRPPRDLADGVWPV